MTSWSPFIGPTYPTAFSDFAFTFVEASGTRELYSLGQAGALTILTGIDVASTTGNALGAWVQFWVGTNTTNIAFFGFELQASNQSQTSAAWRGRHPITTNSGVWVQGSSGTTWTGALTMEFAPNYNPQIPT